MNLPEWEKIQDKQEEGLELDAVELFIMENEPAGIEEAARFRVLLSDALKLARTSNI